MSNYLDRIAKELIIPDEEVDRYVGKETIRSNVINIEALRDKLRDSLTNPTEEEGLKLESEKTHEVFRARQGEFTIESGHQGCGKSARHFLRAMAFAIQGQNSCIASMEMQPVQTLKRGLFQFVGNSSPHENNVDLFIDTFKKHIKLFAEIGTQSTDKILALVRWCADNNIQHIFIDSLMKCSLRSSDIDTVEDFANKLQGLAKDLNIHIWLIAHQTKAREGFSKEDGVRGSGMLVDLCDNFIYYEKNIRKFELAARKKPESDLTDKEKSTLKQPDFFMEFRKQRHSTIALPRTFGFWGHPSMQFLPFERATKMLPEDWINGRFN